jgi:hypothetical protein
MDAAAFAGGVQRDTPTIPCASLRLEQTVILKAPDQPGELPFVLLHMCDQIAQSRARVPNEKAQDFPLHMGKVVAPFPKHPVLLRAKQMHDGVDGCKDVIGQRVGFSRGVQAGHVDILNRFRPLEKPYLRVGARSEKETRLDEAHR